MTTIVIASGGTGGHLYPTIAVAEAIRSSHPDAKVVFIGTPDRIESREVPKLGYEFYSIDVQAPGRSVMGLLRFPFKYYNAFRRSKKILSDVGAGAFLGGGAYLSVPVAFAAKRLGIPIAILETNAVAGRANRVIAGDADKIFLTYEESRSQFPAAASKKIQVIGTPVRDALLKPIDQLQARMHFKLDPARKTVLVFGGSLGARSINTAMAEIAPMLVEKGYNVIWQTGTGEQAETLRSKFGNTPGLCILAYISEMAEAYAASDLVVCRSGASTLAELSTLGKPAILIPYPHAAMNHQERNANAYGDRGAAHVVLDREIGARLQEEIMTLMQNDDERYGLAKKMASPENITARNVVAEYLVSHAHSR